MGMFQLEDAKDLSENEISRSVIFLEPVLWNVVFMLFAILLALYKELIN